MANSVILLILLMFTYLCNAYKILVVFPFPAKSHNNLGNGYVRHLLKAGHEVTYITPFPLKNSDPKLHQIDVSSNREALPDKSIDISALMRNEVNLSDDQFLFFCIFEVVAKNFQNENVLKLLGDTNQNFDVIIAEWMFTEVYSGFSVVFDCPFIWSSPYEPHANIMALIDETTNPAYIPYLVSNYQPPFSFLQRVEELYKQTKSQILKSFYFYSYDQELYQRVFEPFVAKRGKQLPAYSSVRLNASMMLGGTHVSLSQPLRLPQNYKYVGGYHIEDDIQPLPENLQKIMDNAKNGAIYFSLGSNLKSKDLDINIKNSLIKIFGELKQTVIWKFEEKLENLPKNVHIVTWAPQMSILSHPNCVLFITHGGLLSVTEAVHFGVPIIGIPVFTDQFSNINRVVHKGIGRRVDLSFSLASSLKEAIVDIVDNPKYAENAKMLSIIYHDRPIRPGAELVHWVEHVVRTRGANHLRSPALMVPWYQKFYLDLIVLIVAIVIIAKVVLKGIVSKFFSKECNFAKKIN